MHRVVIKPSFDAWRRAARRLVMAGVEPRDVLFDDGTEALLPGMADALPPESKGEAFRVPPRFVKQAEVAADFRADDRWSFLYGLLWRVVADPSVMRNPADEDVVKLDRRVSLIRRDVHKMHAFVRFRKVVDEDTSEEHFVAFHRPDHFILHRAAPFFRERFGSMRWTILTPDASASWNGKQLTFGEGVPASAAPETDALEDVWRTYYANIFNPARPKVKAMKAEMNVRHWRTLPETQIIPDLLKEAPKRAGTMIARTAAMAAAKPKGAESFIPPDPSLDAMRDAIRNCRGCELCDNGSTQAVFGEGPSDARIVFVGEQPGDNEDLAGRPFVGPAGQLMDEMLHEAGVDRRAVYVTNTVKHFHFVHKGKFRLHQKPTARHVSACKPWLEQELATIRPDLVVALGSTAAQALMGRQFRVTQSRGQIMDLPEGGQFLATIHPSAILRIPDDATRQQARADFVSDMRLVAQQLTQAA
ncbi:MAG: UdgX family uracil-DNA binding protein [Planctomycetota bacterium]